MKNFSILFIFILFLFSSSLKSQDYCISKYANKPGNHTSNAYFLEVSFGSIHKEFDPSIIPNYVYYDYTSTDSTELIKGKTYNFYVKFGGKSKNQTITGWIDFNNNKTFEESERIFLRTIINTLPSKSEVFQIKIPDTIPEGITRLRIATSKTNNNPYPCLRIGETQHDFKIIITKKRSMEFQAIEQIIPYPQNIGINSKNNLLLGVNLKTNVSGLTFPLSADSFFFTLKGSYDLSIFKQLKLIYSGENPDFHEGKLLDSLSPKIYVNNLIASQKLKPGNNFFWILADISESAKFDDEIVLNFMSARVLIPRIPSKLEIINRKISYAIPQNVQGFVEINKFKLYKDSFVGSFPLQGYKLISFTKHYDTGLYYPFELNVNNRYPSYVQIWLDINKNGVFSDNERIYFDSILTSTPSVTTKTIKDSLLFPPTTKIGYTRMRLMVSQKKDSIFHCIVPPPSSLGYNGYTRDIFYRIRPFGHPLADFRNIISCFGNTVLFTNYSNSGGPFQLEYFWDFGDGDTSHRKDPEHIYKNPGYYLVKLVVKNNYGTGVLDSFTNSVMILEPDPDFKYSLPKIGSPTYFINNSFNAFININNQNSVFRWNFNGPGLKNFISKDINPAITFDSAGTYRVKLVSGLINCKDSIEKQIKVPQTGQPKAYFTLRNDTVYQGESITLFNYSENSLTSGFIISPLYFNFFGQSKNSPPDFQVALDSIGTYTISIIATNSKGSDTFTRKISVVPYPAPEAGFFVTKKIYSPGEEVFFIDQSENFPSSWVWGFGNGDSSYIQNPTYTYSDTGHYSISLIASNRAGTDTAFKPRFVRVSSEANMCRNQKSILKKGTIYDSGGKNGDYDLIHKCQFFIQPTCGIENILVIDTFDFETGGFLRVYDGKDASGIPLFTKGGFTDIYSPPDTLFSHSGNFYIEEIIEIYQIAQWENVASGFEARWDATIDTLPEASIKTDSVAYVDHPFKVHGYSPSGEGLNFYWMDPDIGLFVKNSSDTFFTFSDTGIHKITLIVKNCVGSDTTVYSVRVINPSGKPEVHFYASKQTPTLNEKVRLYDTSDFGPSEWKWSIWPSTYDSAGTTKSTFKFVNSNSDSSEKPVIIFLKPGYFNVCLTATNQKGTSSLCKRNYIRIGKNFNICSTDTITDLETGYLYDDGGPTGNYSNSRSCRFRIKTCGEKLKVVLKEMDIEPGDFLRIYGIKNGSKYPMYNILFFPYGYTGTLSQHRSRIPDTLFSASPEILVEFESNGTKTKPGFKLEWKIKDIKARFTTSKPACENEPITFINTSKTASTNKFFWSIMDTLYQTSFKPFDKSFYKPGDFKVIMHFKDSNVCSDTVIKIIRIHPKPKAGFIYSGKCLNDTFSFLNKSLPLNSGNSYNWNFSYTQLTDSLNPSIVFPSPGQFPVILKVTSENGCMDSVSANVEVLPLPVADFSFKKRCNADSITFTNFSSGSGDSISSYFWDFGDGKFSKRSNPSHHYLKNGIYDARLFIATVSGCMDTAQMKVKSNSDFFAGFSSSTVCLGDTTTFTDKSSPGIDSFILHEWDFGGGNFSNSVNPEHVFISPGSHQVKLKVYLPDGCMDSVTKNIMVFPLPKPGFSITGDSCFGGELFFNDKSQISSGSVHPALWEFSNGDTGRASFKKIFQDSGKYSFEFTVKSDNGCIGLLTDSFMIYPLPDSDFDFTYLDSGTVFFSANTGGLIYSWDFDNGLKGLREKDTIPYSSNGTYYVLLTTTNQYGCFTETHKTIVVTNVPVSLDELETPEMKAFPNPAGNVLHIKYSGDRRISGKITLFNMTGQQILSVPANLKKGVVETLNLEKVPKGLYHLVITGEKNPHEKWILKVVRF